MRIQYKLIAILFFGIFQSQLFAQSPTLGKAKDPQKILVEILDNSNQVKSVRSDFVQEKTMSMLSEKSISSGKLHYKKPGKIRMEYKKPFQYLIIINDGKVMIKDEGKSKQFDTGSSKMFRQVNDIIMQSIDGSISKNKDYQVNYFESDKEIMIELVPLVKKLKAYITTIQVYFDKKDRGVNKFILTEASGDILTINFINREMNAEFSNEVFDGSK